MKWFVGRNCILSIFENFCKGNCSVRIIILIYIAIQVALSLVSYLLSTCYVTDSPIHTCKKVLQLALQPHGL